MKQVRTLAAHVALAALALPLAARADLAATQAQVQAADSAYWKAFNHCDYAALDAVTAEDVEFYHDLGGITRGRADLTASVRNNICAAPDFSIRRDAAPEETAIFLLTRGGDAYGALLTGTHHFFQVAKANGAATPTDNARFSALWVRQGSAWKLSRVVSYDHQPVAQAVDRKALQLSAEDLERFTGSYAAKIQPVLVFQRVGGNLSVDVGSKTVMLYPMSATKISRRPPMANRPASWCWKTARPSTRACASKARANRAR
jgi:hypothetical protein